MSTLVREITNIVFSHPQEVFQGNVSKLVTSYQVYMEYLFQGINKFEYQNDDNKPTVNVQQKNHLVSALSEMYLFMVQVAFLVSKLIAKLIAYLFYLPG